LNDAFNTGEPADDWRAFGDIVTQKLQALGAADPAGLARFLLPDILTFTIGDPGGFPNGRRLEDDVIDTELGLITNGAVTSDCVAKDSAFQVHVPVSRCAESVGRGRPSGLPPLMRLGER
jgi:hypothetical protein